jgi:preprotein translocase subunit Sec63
VEIGSFDTNQIKRAYRSLAMKYHPDKNPGHRDSFELIVKAYETLTDQEKYNNYIKYGNPDGSMAYKAIEIAMPSFLFSEEYQGIVIFVFFVGFICFPIVMAYNQ